MIKHLRLFAKTYLGGVILLLSQGVFLNEALAQNNFWEDVSTENLSQKAKQINHLRNYRLVKLNTGEFKKFAYAVKSGKPYQTSTSKSVITLPMPDGTWQHFRIVEHTILSPKLAKKLPNVRTFAGVGVEDPSASLRMDWTSQGFHAMVMSHSSGTFFIDPYPQDASAKLYTVFHKKDVVSYRYRGKGFRCNLGHKYGIDTQKEKGTNASTSKGTKNAKTTSGAELRTYRLAVAATGEYTDFHGGTVSAAQNAIVTLINRVNNIYMQEVAISFSLVDNSKIIFTDAENDPFTNDDVSLMINQSQTVIDDSLGSANYDIGHTLGTAGGGLAQPGGVCRPGLKARGVTGLDPPSGEILAIDFMSHEIGHQFSASHTFNGTIDNCAGSNRSPGSAYEPGSGSTIMGYAGICGADNLQNNSDPYFHTKSFDAIVGYSTSRQGNDCPTIERTTNNLPEANAGVGGYNIPISTPFTLTGSATDADANDILTYCWEQFDLGPAGAPNNPMNNAPLFRSFPPTTSPSRTFPKLSDILNNTQSFGEILPDYTRTMTFKFTVRDNRPIGGVDNDQISLNVIGTAGPFLVSSPNTNVTFEASTTQTITWDVANTNLSPINCSEVNILLSTDGGITFPFVLAERTPNDGTQRVVIPDQPGNRARIKIEAADNVFFDISNSDFIITAPNQPTFSLVVLSELESVCAPSEIIINVETEAFRGFSGSLNLSVNNLPGSATAIFSQNNFQPTENKLTLTIGNTNTVAESGIYEIEVQGSSGTQTKVQTIEIEIINSPPDASTLLLPADNTMDRALKPIFDWEDNPSADTYEIQVAEDDAFTQIVEIGHDLDISSYQLNNRLAESTTYYWRVKGTNLCGEGVFSQVFSFQTLSCNESPVFTGNDLPITISELNTSTIESRVTIQENYLINDVDLLNLNIDHTFIGDLTAFLISPAGTEVLLFRNICGSGQDIRANLDDEATTELTATCPPVDSDFYRPQGSLSDFVGETTAGDWVLRISDDASRDGGVLLKWDLGICITDNSNGNTLPFVLRNHGLLSFPRSQEHLIDSTMLMAGDLEDEQSTLQYIIRNTPALGALKRNGVSLNSGDSFTQDDLNNNLITYAPNDRINLEDQFIFVVQDSQGFQSIKDTFEIILDIANPIESFNPRDRVNIYPNPSPDIFEVEMNFADQGEFTIQLYDLSGQLVKELIIRKKTQLEKYMMDFSGQASGVYIFQLITNRRTFRKRLMKIN